MRIRSWIPQITVGLILMIAIPFVSAQRTGYSKDEMVRRRTQIMEKAGDGMIILFSDCMPQPGSHFRQDNDFYYFTGIEDKGCVLVMHPKTKRTILFLPVQTARETRMDGINLLQDPDGLEKTGLTAVHPVSYFDEYLARTALRPPRRFLMRLQPRDKVDDARSENKLFIGRKNRLHYNDQISLDNHRIKKLMERYPWIEIMDITDHIDEMRLIKTEEEIAILRRNGKISAEAVKQAMLTSGDGVFEYEVEAAAIHTVLKNGCKGVAYPPIVGSGPNSCVLHYNKNERQMKDGDVLLMDFGGDLDYMCMDISRTWPVSGKFTKEQREAYEVALEVLKACIEAYKPGVTTEDVRAHVAEVMKKKKLDARGQRGGIGHYVGMSVHDVGPRGIPLREGMVFAIEPGLYYPDKELGIRIEDTILITKDGCEVLTKDVPKEIDEVEKLLAKR